MTTYTLNVNGQNHSFTPSSGEMPLLWALRDLVGLTGTKYGCGIEVCGACTVLLNGEPEKSCEMAVAEAAGRKITTVEGLAADAVGAKVQQAWIDNQVPQCGFCKPGMLMSVTGAVKQGAHGTSIANEVGNICDCGTYGRIKTARNPL